MIMAPRARPTMPSSTIVGHSGVESLFVQLVIVPKSIRSEINLRRCLYFPVLVVTIPATSEPIGNVILNGISAAPACVVEAPRAR